MSESKIEKYKTHIFGSTVTELANELSKDSDGLLNLANRNGVPMGTVRPGLIGINPVALAFSHRYTIIIHEERQLPPNWQTVYLKLRRTGTHPTIAPYL